MLQSSNHNAVFWKYDFYTSVVRYKKCHHQNGFPGPDAFTESTVNPVSVLLERRCKFQLTHIHCILFCCRNVEETCLRMPFFIMNCQIYASISTAFPHQTLQTCAGFLEKCSGLRRFLMNGPMLIFRIYLLVEWSIWFCDIVQPFRGRVRPACNDIQ